MPVNPKLITKVAYQILGIPECKSCGVTLDVSHMSTSKYPFVLPFNGPGNSGMMFRLVFNPKGEFIGFNDGKTTRQITVSEDGTLSEEDLKWLEGELNKRNVTLRSVIIKLMTSEKNMESERGVNYYEQFPKFSLRQMLSIPRLFNLVKAYIEKSGRKVNDAALKEELKTKSEKYLHDLFADAFKNFMSIKGLPVSEDIVDNALNNNRVEFVKLVQKGIEPFKAVKYLFNKNGEIEHIDTDDIVVIETRSKLQGTLGDPGDPRLSAMLTAPLNKNTSLLVDVGYLQNGETVELFYRVGIVAGNVVLTRYTKPDENGNQKLSSVQSKTTLEDFAGINDWVGSTVSSTFEVDHDVEENKPGNMNIFLGDEPEYPRELNYMFEQMKLKGTLSEFSAEEVSSNYFSNTIVSARFGKFPNSMGSKGIEYKVSGYDRPVVIMGFKDIEEFGTSTSINVDSSAPVEIQYLALYRGAGDYSTKVAKNVDQAFAIARSLCAAYMVAFDFIRGLPNMLSEIENTPNTIISTDEIFAQLSFMPWFDEMHRQVVAKMMVGSGITHKNMMLEANVRYNDDDGSCNVVIGVKKNSVSNNVNILNLEDTPLDDVMSDPENENYQKIVERVLPVVTGSDFGSTKMNMSKEADSAAEANRQGDAKLREHWIKKSTPEVDQSNAMAKITQCKEAFNNTFAKYGIPFNLSETAVSRNRQNNSVIAAAFAVDDGDSGEFNAVPSMGQQGSKNGDSNVYYKQNQATIPVEYANPNADNSVIRFSDSFVEKFLSITGALQSSIKTRSEQNQ